MSWDKRATTRRSDAPEPSRQRGVNIVYLGVTEGAARNGYGRGATLQVGDSFHLLPGAAITLGSGRLCEITIESELLSDAHTLVAFVAGDDPTMMLTDLDTERGTWVAGACAKTHFIQPGAEFELAQIYRFRCQPA